MTFVILKGPTFFGLNFFDCACNFKFFVDSHTLSPNLNGLLLWVILCAILSLLSSCAASASSLNHLISESRSSTTGAEVRGIAVGIATGSVPYMILNGDMCLASCVR